LAKLGIQITVRCLGQSLVKNLIEETEVLICW
jgi:hypothetical protein